MDGFNTVSVIFFHRELGCVSIGRQPAPCVLGKRHDPLSFRAQVCATRVNGFACTVLLFSYALDPHPDFLGQLIRSPLGPLRNPLHEIRHQEPFSF